MAQVLCPVWGWRFFACERLHSVWQRSLVPWGNKQRDMGVGGSSLCCPLSRDFWGFLITDENRREGSHPWQLLPSCKFGGCV